MTDSSKPVKTLDNFVDNVTKSNGNQSTSHKITEITRGNQRSIVTMNDIVSLAWGAKEILRGDYKKSKYGDIILPFVVLRRLERILEPTKQKVLTEHEKIKKMDEKVIEARLNQITGQYFHNKSKFNLDLLLADEKNIYKNMKHYIESFSSNVKDVFDNFRFEDTIDDLHKQKLLYQVVQHFAKADLDPTTIDNHMMGTVYEELIRRTSEAANEEAGDHFTPREVIRLMVNLLFAHDKELLKQKHIIRSIYDPAAGTGGMLSVAAEYVRSLNLDAKIDAFGQELNPEAYAICKSDMMIKGLDLNRIRKGNSLTDEDGFPDSKFHFMLSNPPFGVDWGKYENKILQEADKGSKGKYGAGLPRKSDGSLLFLMQMMSKMKPKELGGSRIAIVLNGSPLFTGEAGSGESNIRKWIIANDMLEAIVALPDQLFYNTGIFTYIWIVTNNKEKRRHGKVQLINGVKFYEKMKTSLGNKRHYITDSQIAQISKIYDDFETNEHCKVFENQDFGYTRITVERPLKLNFQVTDDRLKRLEEDTYFQKANKSKSTSSEPILADIITTLRTIGSSRVFKDREEFVALLKEVFSKAGYSVTSQLQRIIENALSERDENAKAVLDKGGNVLPDSELRDYENVPLKEDIDEYFEREVKPYVHDAWIDGSSRMKVGYEIPFTRHFYKFKPLRPLNEINAEILKLEKEITEGLKELIN